MPLDSAITGGMMKIRRCTAVLASSMALAACASGPPAAALVTVVQSAPPTTVTVTVASLIQEPTGANSPSEATPTSATTTPTVTDPNSISVTVDCGDDGVANVTVRFGTGKPETKLIGRNPTTLAVGGESSFSGLYGTSPGVGDGALSVSTTPTRGTCTTTLTEYDGGGILAQRSSSGKVTLNALVRES